MKKLWNILKQNKYSNNRGSTMVETLVSFVVLMIVLALIYKMVAFCSTLRMRAHDTDTITKEFSSEMYNKNNSINAINEVTHITIEHIVTTQGEVNGKTIPVPLFYLNVDEERTDIRNMDTGASEGAGFSTLPYITNIRKNISLYNIQAVTFRYTPDAATENEQLIIPKALFFIHKGDDAYGN